MRYCAPSWYNLDFSLPKASSYLWVPCKVSTSRAEMDWTRLLSINGIKDLHLWTYLVNTLYRLFVISLKFADKLVPPVRDIMIPLRLPISNVFKGQSTGAAISGRLCGGVVQVGERLRVLPGDESGIVRCKRVALDQWPLLMEPF